MTRQQLRIKFESSPTPPVILENRLMIFFTRHTKTPAMGPIVSEAITAGKSEKSNEIKLGISGTLILNCIKIILSISAPKVTFSCSPKNKSPVFSGLYLISKVSYRLNKGFAVKHF